MKLPKLLTYETVNKQYRRIVKDNNEIFDFYQKCINLMHKIVEDMSKVKAREYLKTKKHMTGARAISELYEIKILHSFVAHNSLLKSGIVIASYSHLRTIFETILKIYLNKTEPELGELNFKHEILENGGFTKEEKKEIKKKFYEHQYLKQKYVEEKLYSKKTLKSTRKFYSHICSLVHPSINALGACFQIKPDTLIDSTKLGIGLTISNFVILFELYDKDIKNRYRKSLLELAKQYHKYVSEGAPHLIPDNNADKLKFLSYNKLLDHLEGK